MNITGTNLILKKREATTTATPTNANKLCKGCWRIKYYKAVNYGQIVRQRTVAQIYALTVSMEGRGTYAFIASL